MMRATSALADRLAEAFARNIVVLWVWLGPPASRCPNSALWRTAARRARGTEVSRALPSPSTMADADLESGLDWASYVAAFVRDVGGWAALSDELVRRAGRTVDVSTDAQTVEKGLRRLASRGHAPGGKYGRWMLRFFGMPRESARWARFLGQYHSRFADQPARVRLEQLLLWDRPPTSESPTAVWINQALASVRLRLRDEAAARRRLAMARAGFARAEPAARAEVLLLEAFLATGEGERRRAERRLDEAEQLLPQISEEGDDQECYRARVLDQRAYHLNKAEGGAEPDWEGARSLYVAIDEACLHPFVAFRRCAGLAYCTWKLGDVEEGKRLSRLAAQHAGDGGYVRFRVMALNMLARMLPQEEGETLRDRAARLAQRMDDEALLARVDKARG